MLTVRINGVGTVTPKNEAPETAPLETTTNNTPEDAPADGK